MPRQIIQLSKWENYIKFHSNLITKNSFISIWQAHVGIVADIPFNAIRCLNFRRNDELWAALIVSADNEKERQCSIWRGSSFLWTGNDDSNEEKGNSLTTFRIYGNHYGVAFTKRNRFLIKTPSCGFCHKFAAMNSNSDWISCGSRWNWKSPWFLSSRKTASAEAHVQFEFVFFFAFICHCYCLIEIPF